MRNIFLIEGIKGAGKSKWINEKKKQLETSKGWILMETYNESDWNTVIYVFKNPQDCFVILNSGSDTKEVINNLATTLKQYNNITEIYTAIRPYNVNPHLHNWMKSALAISTNDTVKTILL